jgi:glycosyltransferase involved in cell wall biosynthesis
MIVKISVLVPVYNEEKNINLFYHRIIKVLNELNKNYSYEIIFSDNASKDNTIPEIKKLCKIDNNIKLISLSKNFGRNASQLATLHKAKGELIFMIDVDCQDPPEMLKNFTNFYEQGFDIVYGIRNRIKESFFKYIFAKLFYRIIKILSDNYSIVDMGEFVLFHKKIRDEIIKTKTSFPFIRTEISTIGYKHKGINYIRDNRLNGKTNYSVFGLFKYAFSGFISSSTFLLRINAIIGLLIIMIDLGCIIYSLINTNNNLNLKYLYLVNMIAALYIMTSASLFIARLYTNSLQRAVYVIDYEKSINILKE